MIKNLQRIKLNCGTNFGPSLNHAALEFSSYKLDNMVYGSFENCHFEQLAEK